MLRRTLTECSKGSPGVPSDPAATSPRAAKAVSETAFGEGSDKFFAAHLFAALRVYRVLLPDIPIPTCWNIDEHPAADVELAGTEQDLVKLLYPILTHIEDKIAEERAEILELHRAIREREEILRIEEEELAEVLSLRARLSAETAALPRL